MAAKKISPELQAIVSAGDAGYHAARAELLQPYLVEHPNSVRGWVDLGHSLGHLFRFPEAEAAFQKALELVSGTERAGILGFLGHLWLDQGQLEKAKDCYGMQIEAEPDDAAGYLFLANVLLRESDTEGAIEVLTQATKCSQGCREEVHFQLGVAYRCQDRLEDARLQMEQALRLDPELQPAEVALKDLKSALARRR